MNKWLILAFVVAFFLIIGLIGLYISVGILGKNVAKLNTQIFDLQMKIR